MLPYNCRPPDAVGCTLTDIIREVSSPLGDPEWLALWMCDEGSMQGLEGHYRERSQPGGHQEAAIIALSITLPSSCRLSLRV